MEKPQTISWEAPDSYSSSKDFQLIFYAIIIAAAFLIISLFTKNYLFAIFIIVAFFTTYLYTKRIPQIEKYAIGPVGVSVGDKTHAYNNLKSFWIFYEPPRLKELSIIGKKKLMPPIKIQIHDQNPAKIREILIQYIPEKEQEESISDMISKKIGF